MLLTSRYWQPDGVVAMVRPVHSKRKLFNNAKEHKENTTPDEQLEQFSDSKQNKCVSKSLHSKVSEQLVRPEEKTAHKQRPLPHISSSPASSSCSTADTPCKAVKSSVEGAWKQSHSGEDEGRVSEGVAASTPSRARHAMPMSERQQIALLMQMSSPSNTSKLVQDSSSPSPRCYSPYCDSSDPGTPQQQTVVSGSMVGNNSGPRAGGVGKRNERGETPLHVAAIRGDAERVQQLIARGSDVNAVDYAGWTALHEACNRGFVSVAVELINAGASVNAKGLDNETPLHDACVNNHFKLVELLLDSGASTSIVNRRGQTPADVCRSPVILALLQKSARDTSEILDNSICGMSRRAQPCNAGKGLDASRMGPKAEKDVNNKSGDRSCSSVTSSSQAFVSSSSSTSSFSSNYNSNSFGRPSSPRVAMRITASSQARTPDKRNSTDKHFEGRGACDDPYEFKCTKDESRSHSNKDGEGTSGQATFEGKSDVVREEGTEKRAHEEDEDETGKKRKRKEDQTSAPLAKNASKGDKGNKFTGRGSCSLSSATGSSNFRSSGGATNTTLASTGGASPWGSGSQGSPLDANRKSPQSTSNSPKAGIKVEKYDEAVDEDSPRSDALSSTYNNGNSNNSSPKVPPLKIVLSSCSSNSSNNNSSSSSNGSSGTGSHSTSSLSGIEQEFVGPQGSGSGKAGVNAGSSRHLPYVVASSASGSNSQDNGNSNNCVKDESCSNASQNSGGGASVVSNQDSKDTLSLCVKEEPLSPGGGCGEKSATRITRSQRSNTDDATTSSSGFSLSEFYGARSWKANTRNSAVIQNIDFNDADSDCGLISDDDSVADPDYVAPVNEESDDDNVITADRGTFDEAREDDVMEGHPVFEEEPPAELSIPSNEMRAQTRRQNVWRVETNKTKLYEFLSETDEQDDSLKLPVEYFQDFISESLMNIFVAQTNLFSTQKNPNKPVNIDLLELEQWLGLSIYFSISKLPNVRMHWSVHLGPLREFSSSVMSRNRWEEIKSHLHLVDNTTLPQDPTQRDKLFKIRPMVDHLRSKFKNIPMNQHLCVDEQMVPFKGKNSMKQCIPSKPKKLGFKFFVLCDSGGFIHDFLPYTGKVDPVNDPNIPNLGPSSNCVLQLAQVIPPGKNHLLYFDNWFSSLPLIQFLSTKQIFCCGTIRPHRLAGFKLGKECDKELLKNGRGSLEERTTEQDGNTISYVRWCDKRVVNIVSNFAASQPIGTVSRWDSKGRKYVDVQCPNIIQLYNKNMGGVDLADCLISLYRIPIRSKKYYRRLIFHMIDMAIVNAWLLYRRQAQKLSIPEKDISPLALFKLRIAVSLMKSGKISSRPYMQVAPDASIRYDQVAHWPKITKERKTCKYTNCSSGKTNVQCEKCRVNLCLNQRHNCFHAFHNH